MKVVTIIGARPQFIKAATVSRAFKKTGTTEIIVHTGQHFDENMSEVFFREMEIPTPHYNLEVSNLGHGAMTGRMLEKIEEVLLKEKPDYVLVYGDTNSTLAGALAAVKLHIPVAHVEAGLRSFDMQMPEEVNRILTDRISSVLFCPTQTAIDNLYREGYDSFQNKIVLTGDVMYDAVLFYREKAKQISTILTREDLLPGQFVLATIHRAENTNNLQRLQQICEALNEIHQHRKVVLPLHPRTKAYLQSNQIPLVVKVIEPVGYFDMLTLLENCSMVFTDSGGLQKEAYWFKKFCVTLRDQTEWIELSECGANRLTGARKDKILSAYKDFSSAVFAIDRPFYGDGTASQQIAQSF